VSEISLKDVRVVAGDTRTDLVANGLFSYADPEHPSISGWVSSQRLEPEYLGKLIDTMSAKFGRGPKQVEKTASAAETHGEKENGEVSSANVVERFLRNGVMDVRLDVGRMPRTIKHVPEAPEGEEAVPVLIDGTMENFVVLMTLENGLLTFDSMRGRMFGGEVAFDHTMVNFSHEPALLRLSLEAADMTPNELLASYVRFIFPQANFSGELDASLNVHCGLYEDLDDTMRSVSGLGSFELKYGVLVGEAAPTWITNVFPGLKKSRYEFNDMYCDFKIAEGNSHSEMRFNAREVYDIVIEGDSRRDGSLKYRMSIDLLKRILYGEETPRLQRVIIPIYYYTGKSVGGKMVKSDVRFVSPPEFLFDLINKGLFERGRKTVLGR
jgi:hypothetical protein